MIVKAKLHITPQSIDLSSAMAPPNVIPYLGLESHLSVLGVLVPAVYAGAQANTWEAVLVLSMMALCLELAVEVRAHPSLLV